MSDTVSLRLNWKFRWFYTALFLGMATGSGWILSSWLPLLPTIAEPTYTGEPTWMGALVTAAMITMPIFAILIAATLFYTCIYWWSFRLEFNDTHLETKGLSFPFNKHFRCPYDAIVRVAAGEMHGVLTIVPKAGRPLRIGANNLEGGVPVLLKALSRRISADRFQSELQTALHKHTRFEKWYWVITILYIVALIPYFYTGLGHDFVKSRVAWTTAVNTGDFYSVETFSLDPDGSVALLASKGFPREYQALQIVDAQQTEWAFPPEDELLRKNNLIGFDPRTIVIDKAGNPWVTNTLGGLVHWTGNSWEWFVFPDGNMKDTAINLAKTDKGLIAKVASEDTHETYLLQISPASGETQVLSSPVSNIEGELRWRDTRTTARGFISVIADVRGHGYFYIFDGEQWQRLTETPENFRLNLEGDFSLDPSGNLWVLSPQFSASNTQATNVVGRYIKSENNWQWIFITSDEYYESFMVDSRGRLWLKAKEHVDVYEIAPDQSAHQLVSYTPDNSNFQNDFSKDALHMGVDGRLWVADRKLVWIDTNALNLPSPMPEWEIALTSNEANWFLWWPLLMIVQVVAIIMSWRLRRRLTSKNLQGDAQASQS